MKVVVIGAGLGGLAVALRLQGAGHEVVVLEQGSAPGGRASRLRDGGYTWDTGPSLITMPWVLEDCFAAAGLDLRAEVALRRLDPLYRIRWAGDERHFDFADSPERLEEEVARFSVADARRVRGFLAALRPIYEQGVIGAGRRAFPSARSFAAVVPSIVRLGAVLPLHRFVARHFHHPRVREAFSFHSLFIGGDPFRVPAIYGALVYLQVLDGGWYADGGVYSVVEAMARPLDVRCGARVEAIERRAGRRARGARSRAASAMPADVVVSNADVLRTHELLGRRPPRRRLRPTMSCLLLYLGTDRAFRELLHHTLLVGPGYRGFIRDVTRGRALPRTFSTYVHAPARTRARDGGARRRLAVRAAARSRTCGRRSTGAARPAGCATRSSRTSRRRSAWPGWRIGPRGAPDDAARLRDARSAPSTATRSRSSRPCTSRPTCGRRTASRASPGSTTSAAARTRARGSPAFCSAPR